MNTRACCPLHTLRTPLQGIKSTSIVFKGSEQVAEDPYALFCAEDRNGCHLEVGRE